MRVVNLVQGTQEWLDWRVNGIGSSDAMVIAAHHGLIKTRPWMQKLDDLFQEKMSGVSRVIENARMARGKSGEAAARAAFEARTGIIVSPVCGEMDDIPQIRASFDGITFGFGAYVEIKCPNEKVHAAAKQGVIIDYYRPQVAHQGIVTWGNPDNWPVDGKMYFASYVPENGDLAVVEISAADFKDFAKDLFTHEVAFLTMLNVGVAPCGSDYLVLATEYSALDQQLKDLNKRMGKLKDAMIQMAEKRGVDSIDGGGCSLGKQTRKGTIDYEALCSHYTISKEEREKYRQKDTEFWQVRVDPKHAQPFTGTSTGNTDSGTMTRNDAPAPVSTPPAPIEQVIENATDDFWTSFGPPTPARPKATTARKAAATT
jgi:putative phage-type endonuclease